MFIIAMVIAHACCLNGLKLRQSDLWDHVNYGRVITTVGALPKTEPLLPLATTDRYINPAWGSQVLMAVCIDSQKLGLAGMQTAHGLLVLLSVTTIGFTVGWKSRSAVLALLAALACLYVNWQQFLVVRPQALGVLFFTGLFGLLSLNLDRTRWGQAFIVLSFVVWANLHGSFTMGLFLIGIVGIGRLIDFTWQVRRVSIFRAKEHAERPQRSGWQTTQAIMNRSGFTRLLLLGICCAFAVLVNPYGVNVYDEVLRVGGHPNMQSMIEWRSLSLSMKQGRAATAAFVVLLFCMAFTTRRLQMQNVLLLLSLGGLMLWSSRMINWWAPIVSYLIGIHGASVGKRLQRRFTSKMPQTCRAFRQWTVAEVACALIAVLVVFSISPLGQQTFGRQIAESALVENGTPLDLAAFITGESHDGSVESKADNALLQDTVFCPAEWTGYLMSETRLSNPSRVAIPESIFLLRPMVSTHVHVIPPAVWSDFLKIHHGEPDSPAILKRYQIDTVIVDRSRQQRLARLLAASEPFELIYQGSNGQVWQRITERSVRN